MRVAHGRSPHGIAVLAVSASIIGVVGSGVGVQTQAPLPVISKDPAVQRQIEAQLTGAASVRLAPSARIASLNLSTRPLREVLDSIAAAGKMTLRYAAGMTGLDAPSTVALSDQTIDEGLRAALKGHPLTFQATGPTTAFIHPDTPAAREKYTATVRVFPIARSNPMVLAQQLNRELKPTTDGFRAMVLAVSDSPALVVRAIPELMSSIATWIAEHDKGAANALGAISARDH